MNTVLHLMTGASAGCRLYRELFLHEPWGSIGQGLPPVIRRWSKFAQPVGACFPVSLPLETPDAVQMECCQHYRGLLHQVLCVVQFRPPGVRPGTHRCYRR